LNRGLKSTVHLARKEGAASLKTERIREKYKGKEEGEGEDN